MPRSASTGQFIALAALLLLGAALPAAGAPLPPKLQPGSKLAGGGGAEDDWQVLSYGFAVDPGMPGFIKRTTQLFRLSEDDVSVAPASLADGETVYSTAEETRATKIAKDARLEPEPQTNPSPLRARMLLQEVAVGNATSAGPELVVAGGETLALALALSLGLGLTAYVAVDPVAPNKGSRNFLTLEFLDLMTDVAGLWLTEKEGDLRFANDPSGVVRTALLVSIVISGLSFIIELGLRSKWSATEFREVMPLLQSFHFACEDSFQTALYAFVAAAQASEEGGASGAAVFAVLQALGFVLMKLVDMMPSRFNDDSSVKASAKACACTVLAVVVVLVVVGLEQDPEPFGAAEQVLTEQGATSEPAGSPPPPPPPAPPLPDDASQGQGGGPACVAGRGDHYIEHGGYTWRTLDGADPQGGDDGDPNHGCQRIDYWGDNEPNYLPLPAGWVLAPNDATSIAVAAAHGWSTACPVLADGTAWWSANSGSSAGDSCGSSQWSEGQLATSGGTYTVVNCNFRVLARCG